LGKKAPTAKKFSRALDKFCAAAGLRVRMPELDSGTMEFRARPAGFGDGAME
jgi:hypothetical protein